MWICQYYSVGSAKLNYLLDPWSISSSIRMDLACQIALDATSTVCIDENGKREIDIKRYAKVEKVCSFVSFLLFIDW